MNNRISYSRRTLFSLTLTFFTSLLLFSVLAAFVAAGALESFDTSVLLWVNSHASPYFDSLLVVITELGGVIVVTAVTIALFGYYLYKKQYPKAVFVALGVGGAAAMGAILKSVFERARPDLWEWLIIETNFSFPSGHAIDCSALALCAVALLWRTKWRALVVPGAIVYIVVVSLSRLYLGVHYPSDIVGGWLLSVSWLSAVASLIYLYQVDNAKKKML